MKLKHYLAVAAPFVVAVVVAIQPLVDAKYAAFCVALIGAANVFLDKPK